MRLGQSPQLTDPADIRFRLATVKSGCWVTFAVSVFIVVYAIQTWHAGHRAAMLVLAGTYVASNVLLLVVVPLEAIVVGRWRETFFMSWSFAVILSIVTLGLLDRFASSPLMLPLFMPLIFSGMSYPIRTAIVISSLTLVGYLLVAVVHDEPLAYGGLMFSCLGWTGCMAIWQAHLRNIQRGELERHRDDLAHASRVDPLTGALNRRGFEERLGAELEQASTAGHPLTLAILDLDDFKEVNDRDGHAAGDALLVLVVERITSALRPGDAIGRVGGDEFAVVLPDTGDTDAEAVIDRLRGSLGTPFGVSFGHSCFPAHGVSPDELMRHADETMYTAKRARPGRRTAVDLSWATALADAVDRRMGAGDGHATSVARHAAAVAAELGWSDDEIGHLRIAATLHDVGKVAVPDRVLQKPGPLSPAEFEQVRCHPTVGAQIVARIDGMQPIASGSRPRTSTSTARVTHAAWPARRSPRRRGSCWCPMPSTR
jgi:diguanylate cyclase (GGDEF)-like protein